MIIKKKHQTSKDDLILLSIITTDNLKKETV